MSARHCLPALFVPLVLLFAACADAQEEIGETPAASPTAQPSETPTATASAEITPTPTPTPSGIETLPSPEPGYRWFITPEDMQLSVPVDVAMQVPADWTRFEDLTFLPPDTEHRAPYSPVPQLTVLVAPPQTPPPNALTDAWEHPFILHMGRQGGGSCSGDVSDRRASPSSQLSASGLVWDLYMATCGEVVLSATPGISYEANVAETRVGTVIYAVIAFDVPGETTARDAFEKTLEDIRFALR